MSQRRHWELVWKMVSQGALMRGKTNRGREQRGRKAGGRGKRESWETRQTWGKKKEAEGDRSSLRTK